MPGIALSTDVIVGFCGETEAEYEATLELLETVRFDQVFAAAYSERPGTPATRLADDVPAAEKRRRLVELLAVQEAIGLERNRAWLGRTTEVLVDAIVPPRAHDHDEDDEEAAGTRRVPRRVREPARGRSCTSSAARARTSSSTSPGTPTLLGAARPRRRSTTPGPYALRGRLA